MKMLFSSPDQSEVKQVKKMLFEAGVSCEIRKNPVAQGLFGIPACPELWINEESDILKALKLVGRRRLSEMTVIFPTT